VKTRTPGVAEHAYGEGANVSTVLAISKPRSGHQNQGTSDSTHCCQRQGRILDICPGGTDPEKGRGRQFFIDYCTVRLTVAVALIPTLEVPVTVTL
jgi:hypothetical protein